MNYKCIIFDCDGVLVDSEEISTRVLLDMIKKLEIEIDEEYALDFFSGTALQSIFQYIEKLADKKLPDTFEKEYRKKTFELFETELKPINGIAVVIDKIKVPICVASSGPLEKIKLNLKVTGLLEKFAENIFSSYEIGSWKPNPEIFEYAANKMGYLPKDCLVVEDSIAGIIAAKQGGFDVCGYTNMRNRTRFETEGAIVIEDMKELIEILEA